MIKKRDIKKIERLEIKEERELLRESAYLTKLKEDIRKRNKTAAAKIAKKIESYEFRLERSHKRVLEYLKALKAEDLVEDAAKRLDKIEEDINFYREDLLEVASRDDEKLREFAEQEKWDELAENVIKNLKRDIEGWLALDKKLIEFEKKLIKIL